MNYRPFGRFSDVKRTVIVLTFITGFTFQIPVQSNDYHVGIVNKGAFLLDEVPNVDRGNKTFKHGRVGYLPIGTLVYFKDVPIPIGNKDAGRKENYYKIFSSSGNSGLLRNDLFVRVVDKSIGVVRSSSQIVLHNPEPNSNNEFTIRLKIGRYDGAFLEIIDKSDDEYLRATLVRTYKTEDLPKTEKVRLWREYLEDNDVILVKPAKFDEESLPVPRWLDAEHINDTLIENITSKIQDVIDNLSLAKKILSNEYSYQCISETSVDAGLNPELFGIGFSLRHDITLKPHQVAFRVLQRKLEFTGKKGKTYYLLKSIRCDDGLLERMNIFTLQEKNNSENQDYIRLKDLQNVVDSEWITSLSGKDVPFRMVRISNGDEFQKIMEYLDNLINKGESFISNSPHDEKEALLNLILHEISYFDKE